VIPWELDAKDEYDVAAESARGQPRVSSGPERRNVQTIPRRRAARANPSGHRQFAVVFRAVQAKRRGQRIRAGEVGAERVGVCRGLAPDEVEVRRGEEG